ncbi:nuclear pore complex subunit nup133 [Colletotrichum truncatum]|uniref:Nuclear pore complex subunit nup133 n=1 Tax=Colletotrichum truncatum TaxID=5467 RepID=A0ACC3ZDJ1_COLTU|nr:nuclear pore complex subunit nup133 [Colletotrichum truncatum]KAF6794770.1 nuclear pore complex subunit nup133 [Colletotrichum truncatum]
MFSPSMSEGGPATATRSRRRQRPVSNESLAQQPKAKRQRLPLTEQTFVNPDVSSAPAPEMYEVKSDKVATLDVRQDGIENHPPITPTPRKELSVRAKKPKGGERPTKGDGSVVLTTNNAYTVSKLPALPDRIRADASAQQHGDIFSNGYALSLSHTHAVVWPYTTPTQSPETFTFTLPYPSKHASEPLPLGCLVSPSASSIEPGLVVVMPVSGKIAYWESISSAATLDFIRQQRHGVEGAISGMYSGERVIQITNAESAGFVLAFSSGRLAYMNVRDGHGRPTISVQFLRTSLGPANGGLFGSIRHALTHTTGRGDIAAVRAERTARVGERNVVAATLKGRLHAWRIHRGGHHDTIVEADMQEEIIDAIREVDPSSGEFHHDTFEVVDFTFVPKGLEAKYRDMSRLSDAMASDDINLQHLLLLVSLTKKRESHYSLVEVILSPSSAQVGMVRPITSYKARFSPANPLQATRPRLYLPRPALVAFIVLDKAVVVASIGVPPESPDAQLQEDNHIIPPTYEDVITLSDNNQSEVLGSGFEEPQAANSHEESRSQRQKTKNPAVVLIVRGSGVVRLTTTDIDRFGSDKPPKVTPKSKLEQAVFFGNKQDTPLVFDGRKGVQFSDSEIAEAALQLSHEIMSSSTPHISSVPASLEDNLSNRVLALERLMLHLKQTKVNLDRRTRWLLLSHAEKMMVSTILWKRHEAFTNERPANDKKDLIAEIVEFIHQDDKTNLNRNVGEVDRVRHWFIHDVDRLEIFIAWAYEVIKYMYKDHIMDDVRITRLMYEAQQVNLVALITALDYRQKKLSFYGLEDEELDLGIVRENYEGLPEPWTGCHYICNNLKRLLELSHTWLDQYYPPKDKVKDKSKQPDPALLEKINSEISNLTDQYLVSLLEASRWNAVQLDSKAQKWSEHLTKLYDSDKNDKILALLRLGKWDESIKIAEKHRCWKALALAMIEQINTLKHEATLSRSQVEARELTKKAESREKQIGQYFDKYGEAFAFPTYEILLDNSGVQAVLDFSYDNHAYRTKFLREKPELAKISWINDIQGENDIDHAAETLLDLGLTREQQVWNKKIELSLGKLALLAESQEPSTPNLFGIKRTTSGEAKDSSKNDDKLDIIDSQLGIVRIQDQLYAQIFPSIQTAVDEIAELQLAMENHCVQLPKKQKALIQIFENSMRRLLKHEALDAMSLIDLLTLVNLPADTAAEIADPFYLALLVASFGLQGEELKMAKRLIWRRCFIRDDWTKINDTQLKDDSAVEEKITNTALFGAFASCYQHQTIDNPFQPFKPSDALGAFTADLDSRFSDMEKSYRDKLLDAMKWEDSILRKYIDKARLEEWTRTTAESAEALVAESVDEATRAAAADADELPEQHTNGKANGSN